MTARLPQRCRGRGTGRGYSVPRFPLPVRHRVRPPPCSDAWSRGTDQIAPDDELADRLLRQLADGHLRAVHAQAEALTQRRPDFGFGWKLLGVTAQRLRRPAAALAAKQRAAALLPQDAQAHNNLGNALSAAGRFDEAVAALQRAIALQPGFAQAHNNLGLALQYLHRHQDARASFERALQADPGFAAAHSNLLFMLSHDASQPPEALLAAHLDFDRRHGAPLRATWRPHGNPRDPERRLRLGFVSGDLRQHAVAHFVAPIWQALDRSRFEIHAYSTWGAGDAQTAALRALTARWTDAAAMDDEALAETIRADGIDILFDLSGHTRHNRLLVFARKPAPVQVTAIGYPNTTGLAAIDYRISDPFRMPPALRPLNAEQVVMVPCASTFAHGPAPDAGPLPALARGTVTFGSFQRALKVTDHTLHLWARVLHAVPGSRLLVGAVSDAAAQQRIAAALADAGIAAERLAFQRPLPMQQYLALHRGVDLLLDSHPYPGGTTTHHGLWMGVPTVTRTGTALVSWQGASTLLRLGLSDFVAADDDGYVAIARRWAADPAALAALRASLRERIRTHPLLQPAAVAAGFERAMRGMWRRWCAGLPAAPFEAAP